MFKIQSPTINVLTDMAGTQPLLLLETLVIFLYYIEMSVNKSENAQ